MWRRITNFIQKFKDANWIKKLSVLSFIPVFAIISHTNDIMDFWKNGCSNSLFPQIFCPSDVTNSSEIHKRYLQGKVYVQSKNMEARENIAISLLHSNDFTISNSSGEFKLNIPSDLSTGSLINIQLRTKGLKVIKPFLGRMKLPSQFEGSNIQLHLIKSSQNLIESPLFLKQLSTYLQAKKAKNFDPQQNSTYLDVSAYHRDVADYYGVSLKQLAENLPDFARHIIENKELYEDDKELVAAANYNNNNFKKAASIYGENAREKQKQLQENTKDTVQAFIQAGDSYLSALLPRKALIEYNLALNNVNKSSYLSLWLDIQDRLGDTHGLIAVHSSKGNHISTHIEKSLGFYNNILFNVKKETLPVFWGDAHYKLAVNKSIIFLFSGKPNKNNYLDESIFHIRNTFKVFNKEEFDFQWARSHERLGLFHMMKFLKGGTKDESQLHMAKESLENALLVYTETEYLSLRAQVMNSLTNIDLFLNQNQQNNLPKITKQIRLLEKEITEKNKNSFLLYANTRDLADYYLSRSIEKTGIESKLDLDTAIEKYKKLLVDTPKMKNSVQWFITKTKLGDAYYHKSITLTGNARKSELKKSIDQYRKAISEKIIESEYSDFVHINLARSLMSLGRSIDDSVGQDMLLEANKIYKKYLFDRNFYLSGFLVDKNYVYTLLLLSKRDEDKYQKEIYLSEALDVQKKIISKIDKDKDFSEWIVNNIGIAQIYLQYAEVLEGMRSVEYIDKSIALLKSGLINGNSNKKHIAEIKYELGNAYRLKISFEKGNEEKFSLINKSSKHYMDSLVFYATEKDFGKEVSIKTRLISMLLSKSLIQNDDDAMVSLTSAIEQNKKLLSIAKNNNMDFETAQISINTAILFRQKLNLLKTSDKKSKELDKRFNYIIKTLSEDLLIDHPIMKAKMNRELAYVLIDKGNLLEDNNKKKEELFRDAIRQYQIALKTFKEKNDKENVLLILENIGGLFGTLSLIKDDDDLLKKSLKHYDNALESIDSFTKKKEWIRLLEAKAKALYDFGSSGINEERYINSLKKSIDIYKELLIVVSKDNKNEIWADLLLKLADAQYQYQYHFILPSRERIEKSNSALNNYKQAISVFTKEKAPYKWAKVNQLIGSLLLELSTISNYKEEHKKAVSSYNKASLVFTEKSYPEEWFNLNTSLVSGLQYSLSKIDQEDVTSYIKMSSDKYDQIASHFKNKNNMVRWAKLHENQIGHFYSYVASVVDSSEKTKYHLKAIKNFSKAFDVYSEDGYTSEFINTNNHIGNEYLNLFTQLKNHTNEKYLNEAIRHFKVGLNLSTENETTVMLKNNLIRAHKWYVDNGDNEDKKKIHLDKAIKLSKENLSNYTPKKNLFSWVYGVSDLADLLNLREGSQVAIKFFKDKHMDLSDSDLSMKAELYLMEYEFLDKLGKTDMAKKAYSRYEELLCSDPTNSCDIFPAN